MSILNKRLKPSELAELWQCSHGHVLSLIRSGKLRAINIGAGQRDHYVIDPAEIKRFETGGTAKPIVRRPRVVKVHDHLLLGPKP